MGDELQSLAFDALLGLDDSLGQGGGPCAMGEDKGVVAVKGDCDVEHDVGGLGVGGRVCDGGVYVALCSAFGVVGFFDNHGDGVTNEVN